LGAQGVRSPLATRLALSPRKTTARYDRSNGSSAAASFGKEPKASITTLRHHPRPSAATDHANSSALPGRVGAAEGLRLADTEVEVETAGAVDPAGEVGVETPPC